MRRMSKSISCNNPWRNSTQSYEVPNSLSSSKRKRDKSWIKSKLRRLMRKLSKNSEYSTSMSKMLMVLFMSAMINCKRICLSTPTSPRIRLMKKRLFAASYLLDPRERRRLLITTSGDNWRLLRINRLKTLSVLYRTSSSIITIIIQRCVRRFQRLDSHLP